MVLAASRYAFEREPTSADLIHENVEKAIVRLEKNIKPTAKVRKKKKKSSN
jgi:hypothetical protein